MSVSGVLRNSSHLFKLANLRISGKKRFSCGVLSSLQQSGEIEPPRPEKRPHTIEVHGDIREDCYYWLRDDDRKNKEVISHLEAENNYFAAVMADTEELQNKIYEEIKGRTQEGDCSAPLRKNGYYYYTRTLEGKQYVMNCRRKVRDETIAELESTTMDETVLEEILLDENLGGEKHSYYAVEGLAVSPNRTFIAYGEDTSGDEVCTLVIKDLATGKDLSQPMEGTCGEFEWSNDSKVVYYTTEDDRHRPFKAWRHIVGSSHDEDICIFHEPREADVQIWKPRDSKLLFVASESQITSEVRFLDLNDSEAELKVVLPWAKDREYSVQHRNGYFYMKIRDEDWTNSALVVAPMSDPTAQKVLIPHNKDVQLESILLSKNFLAAFKSENALQRVTVYKLPEDGSPPESLDKGCDLEFEEPVFCIYPASQGDFDSDVLRFMYTSLTTPKTTFDHNMSTNSRVAKKVDPVLGGFDSSMYTTKRLWATAPDGRKVPISLVYKKALVELDGSAPLLLHAYGAYGYNRDPYFSRSAISMLDRGFVSAIAHVRGGGEMGRAWYEDGKFLKKRNTFTDLIACAEELIEQKYTSPKQIHLTGASAGGLAVATTLITRPDLFNTVMLDVPFVDVLTTMLDTTIPLTEREWDEWGNPREKKFYDYIKSYSPVDLLKPQEYPHIFATAGLNDNRVAYWEPAKFVAKLRDMKTDKNLSLFKCLLAAGHSSVSGRFDYIKETALEYAFILKCAEML